MTPQQLKASILKYAMQGKLVEQKPEDGTGEDLFCKMQQVSKPNKNVTPIVEESFISLSRFREYLIPLPPVAEQNRIVAKLEEILPLCERLK